MEEEAKCQVAGETGPRAAPLPRLQWAAPMGTHSSHSRPIHMPLTSYCPCQQGKAAPGSLITGSSSEAHDPRRSQASRMSDDKGWEKTKAVRTGVQGQGLEPTLTK